MKKLIFGDKFDAVSRKNANLPTKNNEILIFKKLLDKQCNYSQFIFDC